MYSSDGVVVITSASHAEGREFDPRSKYYFCFNQSIDNAKKSANWLWLI